MWLLYFYWCPSQLATLWLPLMVKLWLVDAYQMEHLPCLFLLMKTLFQHHSSLHASESPSMKELCCLACFIRMLYMRLTVNLFSHSHVPVQIHNNNTVHWLLIYCIILLLISFCVQTCFICRIYAISVKLSPSKQSSGIQCLEADSFKLYCFQTITGLCGVVWCRLKFKILPINVAGVKFIVIADSKQQKVDELLKRIYELYADYVLKNPFYSLDMPIRLVVYFCNLNVVSSMHITACGVKCPWCIAA